LFVAVLVLGPLLAGDIAFLVPAIFVLPAPVQVVSGVKVSVPGSWIS